LANPDARKLFSKGFQWDAPDTVFAGYQKSKNTVW
jgi:hypothetical protein